MTNPNCTAARTMHADITARLLHHDSICESALAVAAMGQWYGGVLELLDRLTREGEDLAASGMWFIIDRTPSGTLEAATGRTRAEWFGLLVEPERRYAA